MNFKLRILLLGRWHGISADLAEPAAGGQSGGPRRVQGASGRVPRNEMYGYGQFNLSNLSQEKIRSDVDTMAKRNFGGFAVEPGGGPTTGLPADI